MGIVCTEYLRGDYIYICCRCRSHLATHDQIVSKAFQGRTGKAYLFNHVVNVVAGRAEERMLITGVHRVADIACTSCEENVGWKYEYAYDEAQKYKEGKFIIERAQIIKVNGGAGKAS